MTCRKFNLQFFGGEKTEKATPRRRNKERDKGNMAKSKDLASSVELICGLLIIYALSSVTMRYMMRMFSESISQLGSDSIFGDGWWARPLLVSMQAFFMVWGPLAFFIIIVIVWANIYQVGFKVISDPFTLKFDKFNPIKGMKKIFSVKGLVEMIKGLAKASILAWMLVSFVRKEQDLFLSISLFSMLQGTGMILTKIWGFCLRMTLVLLIISIIDWKYQKWSFEKSIRMSKQEIKDEYKNMEGDPKIKQKIRQKQREMAMSRMMADVPKSDVVVTNPTKLAIAIQYDQSKMPAPVVLAKGQDHIAERIRAIATEHGIPIVENKPLAHALIKQVEVGESIPMELYRTVAEVLAFVYRLREKKKAARRW